MENFSLFRFEKFVLKINGVARKEAKEKSTFLKSQKAKR